MPAKLLASLAVIALVVGGTWFFGAVVSDSMMVAMGLTAAWYGVVGAGALLLVRSRRELAWPLLAPFAVAVAVIGGWLTVTSLVDRTVDEQVAVGAPASTAGADAGNLQLSAGEFASGAHPTSGQAAVVELTGGERVLTLTGFETDPGPDLRVYLATDPGASESVDLGRLKGNVGNQQYEIPADADLDRLATTVIWCRAFSVEFGSAELSPS